nr:hypothetical protein [Flavobacterium geliluteum]
MKNFEYKGMILTPHNKDCALFEEKIKGKYYALHRPSRPEIIFGLQNRQTVFIGKITSVSSNPDMVYGTVYEWLPVLLR